MQYRFEPNWPGASIGCGAFLILLGLILVSPVVAWLIKGLGVIFVALGLVIVVLGIVSWLRRLRRRDYY